MGDAVEATSQEVVSVEGRLLRKKDKKGAFGPIFQYGRVRALVFKIEARKASKKEATGPRECPNHAGIDDYDV
jgi:hypothetical protein